MYPNALARPNVPFGTGGGVFSLSYKLVVSDIIYGNI